MAGRKAIVSNLPLQKALMPGLVNNIIAIVCGFAYASFALWAGFQHNSQGEFFTDNTISGTLSVDWSYCILFWFMRFMVLYLLVLAATVLMQLAIRGLIRLIGAITELMRSKIK